MSQSQNALGVGLSGLIGLALDADLPRSVIAYELRRAAEILSLLRWLRRLLRRVAF
jgi:hypothetical protein